MHYEFLRETLRNLKTCAIYSKLTYSQILVKFAKTGAVFVKIKLFEAKFNVL